MTLELIPNSDLIFKGPFNVVSTTTLKLANSGNERLAYKIKTTAPKRYCVKPNSGFLDPQATANIQVMLQPQAAGQPDDRTKHKFMVQWVAVPTNYTEDVDNFWKQDLKTLNVQDSKLKCTFADEQPAAVVPNDSHGNRELNAADSTENRVQQQTASTSGTFVTQRSSPVTSRVTNTSQPQNQDRPQDTGDDSSKSRLKQEIDRLKDENDSLKERLKQQESGLRQRTTTGNPVVNQYKSNQQQQNGLVLFGLALTEQIVLVAFVVALLFGFSLGYFLFSCSN
jgi:flagellar biosynthesis GTPase FlhF